MGLEMNGEESTARESPREIWFSTLSLSATSANSTESIPESDCVYE